MQRHMLGADLKRQVETGTLDFSFFYSISTKSLSIAKMNVNDADIAFIASWLMQHPDTTTLNLNNNLIADAGAKQLAIILQKHPAITVLNLQYNKIGNEGVQVLIGALNSIKKRSIQLDLTWNQEISQKGINQLKLHSMREGSSHYHHILFHDFAFHPVTDCPKLEDLAFKALINRGSLFQEDKLSATTDSQLGRIASVLEQHIVKLIPEFLHAVIDENEERVIKLLDSCPELLLIQPPKELVIDSKLCFTKFYAEKALTMVAKRKQFNMFNLLFSYLNKLEEQDDAVKDEADKAIVSAAKAEGISAWKCYDIDNNEIIIPAEYTYYLESLINVMSRETFPNGSETGSERLSEETELALSTLFNMLIPKKAVKLDDYLDVELFLLVAYKTYMDDSVLQTLKSKIAFCIRVIGLIQSVLSPETAKIFCTGFRNIVTAMEDAIKQGNNITDCMTFSDLAKQHKFKDGEVFYRLSRDSHLGLGFEFLCGTGGKCAQLFNLRSDKFSDVKKFMSIKNSKFLENYAAVAAKPVRAPCKS